MDESLHDILQRINKALKLLLRLRAAYPFINIDELLLNPSSILLYNLKNLLLEWRRNLCDKTLNLILLLLWELPCKTIYIAAPVRCWELYQLVIVSQQCSNTSRRGDTEHIGNKVAESLILKFLTLTELHIGIRAVFLVNIIPQFAKQLDRIFHKSILIPCINAYLSPHCSLVLVRTYHVLHHHTCWSTGHRTLNTVVTHDTDHSERITERRSCKLSDTTSIFQGFGNHHHIYVGLGEGIGHCISHTLHLIWANLIGGLDISHNIRNITQVVSSDKRNVWDRLNWTVDSGNVETSHSHKAYCLRCFRGCELCSPRNVSRSNLHVPVVTLKVISLIASLKDRSGHPHSVLIFEWVGDAASNSAYSTSYTHHNRHILKHLKSHRRWCAVWKVSCEWICEPSQPCQEVSFSTSSIDHAAWVASKPSTASTAATSIRDTFIAARSVIPELTLWFSPRHSSEVNNTLLLDIGCKLVNLGFCKFKVYAYFQSWDGRLHLLYLSLHILLTSSPFKLNGNPDGRCILHRLSSVLEGCVCFPYCACKSCYLSLDVDGRHILRSLQICLLKFDRNNNLILSGQCPQIPQKAV